MRIVIHSQIIVYMVIIIFISRTAVEAEREKISQSRKTLKEEHEVYVKEINAAIEQTQKRHGELLDEVWQKH